MITRSATEKDIDALVELNRQIGEFHFEQAPNVFAKPSAEERSFILKALADSGRLFLVAEEGGQVTGFITASIAQNESIPFLVKDPICRVGTVVVDQDHRGSGIGKRLMQACRDWAAESGAVEVRLEVMNFNDNALAFYETLGFETQSRTMAQSLV